jgi:hypothetical protein
LFQSSWQGSGIVILYFPYNVLILKVTKITQSVLCFMENPFTDEYLYEKALQEAEMAFEKAKFC